MKFSQWLTRRIAIEISKKSSRNIRKVSRQDLEVPLIHEPKSVMRRICEDIIFGLLILGVIALITPLIAGLVRHQQQVNTSDAGIGWGETLQVAKDSLVTGLSQPSSPSLETVLSLSGIFFTVSIGVIVSGGALRGSDLRVVDALRIAQYILVTYGLYFVIFSTNRQNGGTLDVDVNRLLVCAMIVVASIIMHAVEGGDLGARSRMAATHFKKDRIEAELYELRGFPRCRMDKSPVIPTRGWGEAQVENSRAKRVMRCMKNLAHDAWVAMFTIMGSFSVIAIILTLGTRSILALLAIVLLGSLWAMLLVMHYWAAPTWGKKSKFIHQAWFLCCILYFVALSYLMVGPSSYGLAVHLWPGMIFSEAGQLAFVALSIIAYLGYFRIIQQTIRSAFQASLRFRIMHAINMRRKVKLYTLELEQLSRRSAIDAARARICAEMDS